MLPLQWTQAADEPESLAVGLRAVLAAHGAPREYDELIALLGLGAAFVAVRGECPGHWPTHARDAALVETADRLGLRLRDLHPPDAAIGLETSAEFPQHFQDSYVPLILRALQHGQTALAWRGWPSPGQYEWGVITAADGDQLYGYAPGGNGQLMPLTGPAYQVYVVEEHRPPDARNLEPAALFEHAARVSRALWDGAPALRFGVKTGTAAYQLWSDALADADLCPHCGEPAHVCQSRLVRPLVSARRHLATWLQRIADALDPKPKEAATRWAYACEDFVRWWQPFESPENVKQFFPKQHKNGVFGPLQIQNTCALEARSLENL